MVKKYRKRPVEIEAIKYDGPEDLKDLMNFVGSSLHIESKELFGKPTTVILIKTLEGDMSVSLGDYVIKGISGEFYPCKPDIFEKSYEFVEVLRDARCYNIISASMSRRGSNGLWPASIYYIDPITKNKIAKSIFLKDSDEAQEFMKLFSYYMIPPRSDNQEQPSEDLKKRINLYLNKIL